MKAYGGTDVGKQRSINQDYVMIINEPIGPFPNLYILADGMGGHRAGEVASMFAVETVIEYAKNMTGKSYAALLDSVIEYTNEQLYKKSSSSDEYIGMGTTLVIATVVDCTLYVANVGDSRLYVIGNGITQITIDHSLVEEMISMGKITRSEARNHERKNVITRAVGVEPSVIADLFEIELEEGSTVLLCSDGLTNMVEDHEIRKIVSTGNELGDKVHRLIDEANRNGGKDNISVILVELNSARRLYD